MTDESAIAVEPEDAKIVTLARSALARSGGPAAAAVRDETGRTYVAATVELQSLRLSAIETAVAMAVSSGAAGIEAVALVGSERVDDADLAVLVEVGGAGGVTVLRADAAGTVLSVDVLR